MRVLVLESEPGSADEVVTQLESSGHSVARCNEPDQPPFPCRGLQTEQVCTLDESSIHAAVVLDSQATPEDLPPAGHDGARCALRRSIPLVVAGPAATPLSPWATRACSTSEPAAVVSAIEEAADAPLALHGRVATDALRSVLDIHGLESAQATAEVTQVDDGLRVVLKPGIPDLETRVREVASIRALAGVREIDAYAPRIGVRVD